jgi:ketosteroid isomerase-like protein
LKRRVTFVLVLLAIAGCSAGNADRSAVEAVDNARREALNARDINRYLALLSRDYRDGRKDFAAEKRELEASFAAYERVSYRPLHRTITVSGTSATISGEYLLKVSLRGQTLEIPGKEDIRLKKQADGWKIVGGL